MNVFLSLIQLITIILICIYEYKKKYTSVFLWATLLIMFGFPHFLSVISKNISYDEDTLIKASIFVILFNVVYFSTKAFIVLIERGLAKRNVRDIEGHKLNEIRMQNIVNRDKCLTKLFFIILVFCLFVLVAFSIRHLGSIANSSWGNFRNLNNELGFSSSLRYANLLFFASAGVALVYKNYSKKTMMLAALGIITFYSMLTGNRITILPAFMTIIIPFVFNNRKKLSLRQVIIFSLIAFFAIYMVYLLRFLRIYGGFYNFIREFNFVEINSRILDMLLDGDGELGLRKAFYHFIYYDNNFANFNKCHTYIRLLLIAIPTSLIPEIKPPDFAISMGSAWSMDPYNTVYSMHPTLYGDCFANLWWFGILLGAFWAVFSCILDKYMNKKNKVIKSMLMVLFGTVYVIAGRGSVYNGFFIGLVGAIVIEIIYLVSRFRLKL